MEPSTSALKGNCGDFPLHRHPSLGTEEGIAQLPSVFFYQAIVQIIPEITARIPRQVGAGPENCRLLAVTIVLLMLCSWSACLVSLS